ncbi:hypothetical protein GCM10010334_23630 [Streptomyces finlayi]|uniref:Uncharacterized protein n=1 Tax=Streptomyces finlayi TaxID=67296 RepID=A0A918WWF5_9ACTN|nr:hypothetical protein [Streptomyces finlayi]GHC89993.1 hypothetical protein GCM10010334_23630 [Streptomyces finlayi]
MTLRSDVARLLAGAGIVDVDVDEAVADEHVRGCAYARVVAVAVASGSREGDRAVVAAILRDPHEMGAKGAVVALVDGIAGKAVGPAEFWRWAQESLLPELGGLRTGAYREFVRRRVDDWLFRLSLEERHVPTALELAGVTDWMQRLLAEGATSPAVLGLLAESGSTRKIRNIAGNRRGGGGRGTG